jgi:hypothetical protein
MSQPVRARPATVARPMPPEPPVTRATRPTKDWGPASVFLRSVGLGPLMCHLAHGGANTSTARRIAVQSSAAHCSTIRPPDR